MRCTCGNKLGERRGDLWDINFRGRTILAHKILAIRCERCGAELVPEEAQAVGA